MRKEAEQILNNHISDSDVRWRGCKDKVIDAMIAFKKLNQVQTLPIDIVSKRFSEQDMIDSAEYGYNYRDTTSFPDKNFEDNCKNNVKQWLTKYD